MTLRRLILVAGLVFALPVGLAAHDGTHSIPDDWTTDTAPIQGTVTEVIDGDTLKIQSGSDSYTVRLIGVDTPETTRNVSPDEFPGVTNTQGGRACLKTVGSLAKKRLTDLLDGARVTVHTGTQVDKRGVYDRLLGYVVYRDHLVNRELIRSGLARIYDDNFAGYETFAERQSNAAEADRGFHQCQ